VLVDFKDDLPVEDVLDVEEGGRAILGGMERVAWEANAPVALLNGKSMVDEKKPLFKLAEETASSKSSVALEGTIDMKPIRGGSTDGFVKLP